MPNADGFFAIGDLVRATGEPLHRIEYIIRSRCIAPLAKIGAANLYGKPQLTQIQRALKEIAEAKAGRPQAGEAAHA